MKRLLILLFLLVSCTTTKYVKIPLTTPPDQFEPLLIDDVHDGLMEYRKSIKHIVRWQNWYNTQVGSNYYNYTNKPTEVENP